MRGLRRAISLSRGIIVAASFSSRGGGSELSRLTLSDGDAGFGTGGAILVDFGADLTILDSRISSNSADRFGGGIYNDGTLSVINSTLSGNSAANGGGISNYGTLSILNSTLSGNPANYGGGIYNDGTLSVINSTLSGNSAQDDGGGIYNYGTLSVLNSTLSGNSAQGDGGGIFNDSGGTLSVLNSTLSSNSASDGGGIDNFQGTLSLANSIVAANAAVNGDANINGSITTNEGGNVFGSNIGSANDIVETDPANIFDSLSDFTDSDGNTFQGGTLADNGGLVATILILEGGAAHNHQDAAALPEDSFDLDSDDDLTEALPVDSRGLPRMDGLLDAGAVELVQIPPQVFVVTTLDDTVDSTDGERSLREAITEANLTSTADTIRFDDGLTGILTLTQGQLVVSDDLTIEGPEAGDLTISGNNSSRIFQFTGGTSELSRLTLSDGDAGFGGAILVDSGADLTVLNSTLSGNSARFGGGGVDNFGTLSVLNSTLSGNSTQSGGGGINNYGGELSVINSTLSGNSARLGGGGGITNNYGGELSVINSTLSDNSTNAVGVTSHGGGIYNAGALSVLNSKLSGNSADNGFGGGIFNYGTLSMFNSTLSGNVASFGGGGIYSSLGTLSMFNSTLSGNVASFGGGGIYSRLGTVSVLNSTLSGNSAGIGGGIFGNNQDTLSLANSIVAANAAFSGDANIYGSITTNEGGNVFGSNIGGASDTVETNPANIFDSLSDFTDLSGNVFQGGNLANNGGPVATILILEGGVADGAGLSAELPADDFDLDDDDDLTEVLPVDARGLPRVRSALDSGALELNIVDLVEPVLNAPTFDQDGNPVVSFSFDPDVRGALWTLKRSTTLEDFDTVAPIFSYDGDDETDTVGSLIFSLDSSSNTISVTDDTSSTDPKAFYRLEVKDSDN